MALFGSQEEKEAKAAAKAQRIMAKYGLENIDPQFADAVRDISTSLAGSGMSEFGGLLANDDKAMNKAQTQYVHAIMEQNFIIIRQLDQISYMLEQMTRR